MTLACEESAKGNPAARRQCAGDPAERRLPQQRRPHHHRRTRRPGRALAGVKVDDVDTYHPFHARRQPHDPAGPRRPDQETNQQVESADPTLSPIWNPTGRDDQTEMLDRVRALDWSRADGATAQVRRRDGAQVGWGRRRLDRPAGCRPRLAAGPTAPPSAAGTPGPPGRRGRSVRRGPTAPRRRGGPPPQATAARRRPPTQPTASVQPGGGVARDGCAGGDGARGAVRARARAPARRVARRGCHPPDEPQPRRPGRMASAA